MITTETVVASHRECINAVADYDYYVNIFSIVAKNRQIMEMDDPTEICTFWNDFWYALPDTKAIHRAPFDLVCDLAEGSYLEE